MISADLGSKLEQFVAEMVKSGRYNSKSEVLREGVRLVQDREAKLAEFDAMIAKSIADADAGLGKPIDEVRAELRARYRAMANRAA